MCLTKITKKYDKSDNVKGKGWKVAKVINEPPGVHRLHTICNSQTYLFDKWYTALNIPLRLPFNIAIARSIGLEKYRYESGFHIFPNKEDAKTYKNSMITEFSFQIYEVEYEELMYEGIQHTPYGTRLPLPCFVANRIKFLSSLPILHE